MSDSQAITRAKFRCDSVEEPGQSGNRRFTFTAVTDDGTDENERYHRHTPSGRLELWVDNPRVSFETSREYYLDFTPA